VTGRDGSGNGWYRPGGPWDPGLQVERTDLAWRRTSLAVAVACIAASRLLAPVLRWAVVGPVVAGTAYGVAVAAISLRRARVRDDLLHRTGHLGDGPGAIVLALTSATVFVSGLAAVAILIHQR